MKNLLQSGSRGDVVDFASDVVRKVGEKRVCDVFDCRGWKDALAAFEIESRSMKSQKGDV